jgi:cyclic pyranopterin phosphate synthase
MTDVRLEAKSGGKAGEWARGASRASATEAQRPAPEAQPAPEALEGPVVAPTPATSTPAAPTPTAPIPRPPANTAAWGGWRAAPTAATGAAVIVASTAGAAGARQDTTGPLIADWLRQLGFSTTVSVVADADIAKALREALGVAVIITTGGTGVSPTDRTPEATAALLDRELPGIAEAIRAHGRGKTPTASLSRGLAGIARGTIIVNLPGSPGGVKDGLAVLEDVLPHLVAQVAGGGPHE